MKREIDIPTSARFLSAAHYELAFAYAEIADHEHRAEVEASRSRREFLAEASRKPEDQLAEAKRKVKDIKAEIRRRAAQKGSTS